MAVQAESAGQSLAAGSQVREQNQLSLSCTHVLWMQSSPAEQLAPQAPLLEF